MLTMYEKIMNLEGGNKQVSERRVDKGMIKEGAG